ncbi:MAG: peptidoglycan DD-metalloendopeptidase family protein [Muribaculaceae bacterium]|nr:peptidoglycan DD-metalloendopeptidase family protein [Muribaculaceae bacterium]
MKKIWISLCGVLLVCLTACDLQPKIMSLPDSVGDFISVRYPALLADPYAQPDIYNSAATDYGVYASPELYGSEATDDYVLYASVSDYIIPPQTVTSDVSGDAVNTVDENASSVDTETIVPDMPSNDYLMVPMYGALDTGIGTDENQITVAKGDTLYALARRHNMTVAELARINNLSEPYVLSVGQVLRTTSPAVTYVATPKNADVASAQNSVVDTAATSVVIKNPTPTTTRVELQEITVGVGDTLYSLSRKYSVPVNDLAVMNNLTPPFGLYAGQHLKVPNLSAPDVRVATQVTGMSSVVTQKSSDSIVVKPQVKSANPTPVASVPKVTSNKNTNSKQSPSTQTAKKMSTNKTDSAKTTKKTTEKISSDPSKKLPKIAARSSSKFSWPVRGRILSGYGAKSNGLFNDGINISATRGTSVKAAENGVVAYAGNEVKGMGNLVIIQHSGGWMTVYAHMDSMVVRRGARVNVGQKIGTVGATGKVDAPQLHFEIRKGTQAYNPTAYLKK